MLKFFIFFAIFCTFCSGSKILFLTPLSSISETVVWKEMILGLTSVGHEVTWVTSKTYPDLPKEKVRQIHTFDPDKYLTSYANPLENRRLILDTFYPMRTLFDFDWSIDLSEEILKTTELKSLVLEGKGKYDLTIVSGYITNCFMGIIPVIGAPHVIVTSMIPTNLLSMRSGNYFPPSFVPSAILDMRQNMNGVERFTNTLLDWLSTLHHFYISSPKFEKFYRHHFGQDLPSLGEIEGSASMLISNSHFISHGQRPHLQDFVEVGGVHCHDGKPLPADLKKFMDSGPVIYFSLGSIVKGKDMGEDLRKMFLRVFSRLPKGFNVLWKWETEEMKDLPKNVKLTKWAPQQDILAHNNTKLFISHGGLLSTQESLHHAVPLLGFPIFFDQDYNMIMAQEAGWAIKSDLVGLTEESLERDVNRLLKDPMFMENAQKTSKIFRDQKVKPIDRFTFWIDYVIRHKGAPHLHSKLARSLNFFQYQSYDVVLVCLIVIYLSYCLIKSIIKTIWVFLLPKKSVNKLKSN